LVAATFELLQPVVWIMSVWKNTLAYHSNYTTNWFSVVPTSNFQPSLCKSDSTNVVQTSFFFLSTDLKCNLYFTSVAQIIGVIGKTIHQLHFCISVLDRNYDRKSNRCRCLYSIRNTCQVMLLLAFVNIT